MIVIVSHNAYSGIHIHHPGTRLVTTIPLYSGYSTYFLDRKHTTLDKAHTMH